MIKLTAWTLALGLASLGASQSAAADLSSTNEPPASALVDAGATVDPASLATSAVALAAQDVPATDDGWNVSFTPYIWVAGTKGDVGIPRGDNEVEIDRDFTDTLSNLKFAFMGALDVEHDRFVAIADIVYLSVGAKAESIRDPQFFEADVDASVLVSTLSVGYRVVDRGPMFVDLVVGGRLVSLDVDLELEGPLTTRRAEASPTNVSPLIGGRVRVPVGRNLALALYGDVGGLKSADIKWQLIGTVQWEISRHWQLAAGYRHMALEHDKNDLDLKFALSGPIVGVSYRF